MAFSLQFDAYSEIGRVRKNNQDAGYASPRMLLVADGMGGAAAGDLASAVAAIEAKTADQQPLTAENMEPQLIELVAQINTRLAELIEADPTLDGMGTTFCGAAFTGTQLGLIHIGDSRCYLLRDGKLQQLTHDHSWVQSLIDEGRLTPQQAAVHPHRSLILKVLNGQPDMTPDYATIDVKLGDRFLFCSDGLSGLIDDTAIAELLSQPDIKRASASLAIAANRAGGHDNITIVIGEIVESDPALAQTPAFLVGSATEREIPEISPAKPSPEPEQTDTEDAPAASNSNSDHDQSEIDRYAPQSRRSRWPSVLVGFLLIALVVGAAAWGVVLYSKSRFFIAEADGKIAIYNGLPGSILGQQLNALTERRDTPVGNLPRFYQRAVANTIGVGSLEAARSTADELQDLAKRCVAVRQERLNRQPTPPASPTASVTPAQPSSTPAPSSSKPLATATQTTPAARPPAPTPTGSSTATAAQSPQASNTPGAAPSGQTNYPTYLAPITPTATEEADPEAC